MINLSKIAGINSVIKTYFDKHPGEIKIPAKDLMPHFIRDRIFPADHKRGLPIRNVLRELDNQNQLHLIPFILAERKQKNTKWFFVRYKEAPLSDYQVEKTPTAPKTYSRQNSDEYYVIDLCDQVLGQKGLRQYRFDFLLGDTGKNGKRARLPVDVYYPSLNLVIEYREGQHTNPVGHFDKPHIKTISGVHRGEQRKIYDKRRREVLPRNGIRLVEISYHIFSCDNRNRIIRNSKKDLAIIEDFLKTKHEDPNSTE